MHARSTCPLHRFHRRACTLLTLLILLPATVSAAPIVNEVDAPDLSTEFFGWDNIRITVVYGKEAAEDDPIWEDSIRNENVRLTITNAQNPNFQDFVFNTFLSDPTTGPDGSVSVVYYFGFTDSQFLGPQHAGVYTLELLPDQVYAQGDLPDQTRTYIPAQELANFEFGLTAPSTVTVQGRLWLENDGTISLVDAGHEADPGLDEWELELQQYNYDFNEWLGVGLFAITNSIGGYSIPDVVTGDYRIRPRELPPEIGTQAVGDPTRGDVKDGWMHFTVTPEMDGQTLVVNFSYSEETTLPNAEHDEFTAVYGATRELRLDVLANDEGTDLQITHLSDWHTTLDSGGIEARASRFSSIRTDGRFVYYLPSASAFGWEQFWYRVKDGDGNTDIERVYIFVTANPVFSFLAIDDYVTTDPDRDYLEIDVLLNDVVRAPHSESTLSVTTDATSSGGAILEVFSNRIRYFPAEGITGEDKFNYTITSEGESSSASVVVTLTDVESVFAPRVNSLHDVLRAIFGQSAYGIYLQESIDRHMPEIVSIVERNSESLTRDENPLSFSHMETLALPFLQVAGKFMLGQADSVEVDAFMVNSTVEILDSLQSQGSPALREDLIELRENAPPAEDFIGKSLGDIVEEQVGISATDIFVPVTKTEIQPDAVHLTTFNVVGQVFKLWKASRPDASEWVEVLQDVVESSDEPLRTLTDPAPGSGSTFYRLSASLEQDDLPR